MKTEAREAPINIRARTSQRDLIDMAASLVSKSRTDFMLDAACREAQDILLDQRLFILDNAQYESFIAELDAPVTAERQARIDDLMGRKSPWE
ncbi:type II toxin-antitoxin system TacA family antitoxin [Enterobacter vonholyi]